jgi:cyclopropane-fatty-acyl-phospholipid synthase
MKTVGHPDAIPLRSRRPVSLSPLPGRELAPSFLSRVARSAVLRRLEGLRHGRLTVVEGGETHVFGPEGHPLHARVRIHDPAAFAQIAFGGSIGAAEAYADGLWDADDLPATIRIVLAQGDGGDRVESGLARLGALVHRLRHRARRNTPEGARENIAAHYDLGNEFFGLFLDPSMTYSCAVYDDPGATLEEAQQAKIERICAKLDLRPGMRVLEIGTGWGALAIHEARRYGVHVTTATLSARQRDVAVERVRAAGLEDRVEVVLADYRELAGRYDRVVSIEMIEAVGWEFYETFFRVVGERLHEDGLALVQAITIPDHRFERQKAEPNHINRLVFPGSCIPSTTALLQASSRASDLRLFHLEEIGPHYARTLRDWRVRLLARWDEARAQGRSARFLRNFEYYLASCEAGYEERHLGDVQLLFARPRARREPILPPLAAPGETRAA